MIIAPLKDIAPTCFVLFASIMLAIFIQYILRSKIRVIILMKNFYHEITHC